MLAGETDQGGERWARRAWVQALEGEPGRREALGVGSMGDPAIVIKSFKKCSISNALDRTEDDMLYEDDSYVSNSDNPKTVCTNLGFNLCTCNPRIVLTSCAKLVFQRILGSNTH